MKTVQAYLSSLMARGAIVAFWLVIIVTFLFFPKLMSLLRPTNSINIFTFPRVIDVQVLSEFEEQTGIKVYVSYFENNDELLVKMRQTKGEGYDLIIPSDYVVDILRQEGLLQILDKNQLDFIQYLKPELLNKYYDPKSEYSLPYFWGMYGIGIDKKFFQEKPLPVSWQAIFDEQSIFYRIGMINNAREAVLLAAFYLFGSIDDLDSLKLAQIQQLLIKQKKWVQTYTDLAPDYLLLSGSCPVVASLNNEIWQARHADPSLDFVVPQEGTFIVVDTVAIPAKSSKATLVYKLLNYLYKPDVLLHHVERFALFPPMVIGSLENTQEAQAFNMLQELPKVDFFRNVLPERSLQELWLALKAS